MKNKLYSILLFMFLGGSLWGQTYLKSHLWNGNVTTSRTGAMCTLQNGNNIVTVINPYPFSNRGTALMEVNMAGDTLWRQTYPEMQFKQIRQRADGNLVCVSYKYAWGDHIALLSPTGAVLQNRFYESNSNADVIILKMIPMPDNSVFFSGYIYDLFSGGSTSYSWHVPIFGHLHPDLTFDWARSIATHTSSNRLKGQAWDLHRSPDGNFIVNGIHSRGTNSGKQYLIKFDSLGNQIWSKEREDFHRVPVDFSMGPNGESYTVRSYSNGPFGDRDILIDKFDANGDSVWSYVYGTPFSDLDIRSVMDSSGNLAIAGNIHENSDWDLFLIQINPNGDIVHGHRYGTSQNEIIQGVQVLPNGNFLIGGDERYAKALFLQTEPNGYLPCNSDTLVMARVGSSDTPWGNGLPIYPAAIREDSPYPLTLSNVPVSNQTICFNAAPCSINAAISLSANPVCAQETLTVTNSSIGSLTQTWLIDGQIRDLGNSWDTLFTGAGTHTIRLIVESSASCTDTAEVQFVVFPPAQADAGPDQVICAGSNATLNANGGGSYTWDNGLGAGAVQNVSPVVTTSYTVTVTDNNGCQDSDQITVSVLPLPNANAGPDQSICAGGSTTLSASGGSSYTWDNGLGSGSSQTVSPVATTSYSVTVTDNNGCESSDQVTVTVNPLPIANAGPDQSICAGGSTTLSASGGSSYTWDNGLGSGSNQSVSPIATTSYSVTVTDNNGCEASDQVTITVNPLPTANAGPDQSICAGGSATLSASGGSSYTWDNGLGSGSNQTVSPVATTSYSVTVTDNNGCEASDQVTITVNPLPTANAGPDQSICVGGITTLSASGGSSYTWDNGLGSGANHTVSPVATTSYSVTVTDNNGCESSDQVTVTVNPLPTANAGPDQSICVGGNTTLSASGGSSYTWDNGLGSGSNQTVSPVVTTSYSVTVTDNNGCEASDQVTVTVNPLPTANAGPDQSICAGGSATLSASGGSSYTWDNGLGSGSNQTVSPVATTSYSVTVTDNNGCEATDQVTITVNPLPTASFTYSNSGAVVTFQENSSLGSGFFWEFGDGGTSTLASPSHSYTQNGTYLVCLTVSSQAGCEDRFCDSILINLMSRTQLWIEDFKVFPNPTTETLFLKSSRSLSNCRVQIIDLNGREVWKSVMDVSAGQAQGIPVGHLAKGTYQIVLHHEGNQLSRTWILH